MRTLRNAWLAACLALATLAGTAAGATAIGGGGGPDGWTVFRRSPTTRIVYVSSSQGRDSNDGLSPDRPVRTLARAFGMLRPGRPDWMLLKRGDAWAERLGSITARTPLGGPSATEPLLIGAYGSGPRPRLDLGDLPYGLEVSAAVPIRNIAAVGIAFYDNKGDPSGKGFVKDRRKQNVGIHWLAPGENVLVEDCLFDHIYGAVFMGRDPMNRLKNARLKNVQVRRCVVAYAWTSHGHCQGLFFANVDGALLEENVLDHNGWCLPAGDLPTWFNHNVYITTSCDPVVARGNFVARGSSTGI